MGVFKESCAIITRTDYRDQRQRLGLNVGLNVCLPLLWPVWQSGAALEPNAVILYLGLRTTGRFNPIP